MERTTFFTIWLIGSFIAYKLIRLDYKKSINEPENCDFTWGILIGFMIVSLIFTWALVIDGIVVNAKKGYISFKFKSKPPKWL